MSKPATHNLADSIEGGVSRLVDLWLSLGEDGPTGNSTEAGDEDFSRTRYLTPLARLVVGALRGSTTHRAVYIDERTRYLPPGLDGAARAALLARRLAVEIPAWAQLCASNKLTPEAVTPLLEELHSDLTRAPGKNRIQLLLLGDCVFVETRAFLQHQALEKNVDLEIEQVFFNAGQSAFSVDDALASIGRSRPDLIAISLFSFDGIPPYKALLRDAANLSAVELEARVTGMVDLLGDAVDAIRAATDASILLHNACGFPLDRVRLRLPFLAPLSRSQRKAIDLIAANVRSLAETRENVVLDDEVGLVDAAGGRRACARPVFDPRDVPPAVFHPSQFGNVLAKHYWRIIEAYRIFGKAKVLLVDFDNTLWSGVMAEGPVSHDRQGQKLLKRLKESGVLLVALSKNDPANIRWAEMELQPEDFVLQKIGWQPKPEGASQTIAELDLAPDAFVLLDDNPVERALVTEQIPGVRALDPAMPETWQALELWLRFPSTRQTDEARRPTELYREAAARRRSLDTTHDYLAMMRSLDLRLGFRVAKPSDMNRLLELTQRTNQFNTTTKRRSAADLQNLFSSNCHRIYVASLRDRFGSLGVVAVAVVERAAEHEVIFDSVIMSCRAMGFGLEQALIRKVIDREPAQRYVGLFLPSDRNSPAASLFQGSGFRNENGAWVLETGDQCVPVPAWFAEDN